MELSYLKNFNDYTSYVLNESLGDAGQKAINRAFLNMNEIPLSNGEIIYPKDIVKVVNEAISWIAEEFRTYYSFAKDCNIIYLVNEPRCDTMAVDQYLNMYMDVLFIYKNLKMNPELVAAVIMHEILHVVYNHIERGKNWLSANGRPLNDANFKDTNLAADIEVNTTLVNKHIIAEERLINEIHGLFLKKNESKTNLSMEYILENEKLMDKLRSMVNKPKDTRQQIETSQEWDDGYKAGWDKIAELLDKYGAEDLISKLKDAGIIDNNGRFIDDIDNEDILGLNFLTIKTFQQFIFENKNENMFKSYDDGFKTGVRKAITMIENSLNDVNNDMSSNGQGNSQPVPKTNLKSEDLKKLNLPKKDKDNNKKGNSLDDKLPTNTNDEQQNGSSSPQYTDEPNDMMPNNNSDGNQSDNDDNNSEGQPGQPGNGQSTNNKSNNDSDEQSGSEQNSQSGGQKTGENGQSSGNGGGQSDKESGDGDVNKLADDLKNKKKSNGNGGDAQYADKPTGKGKDDTSIGNTGSFIDDPDSSFAKDVLKNSGYSDEDIKNIINDTIEKNKRLNTPEGIKEKRKKLYSKLSSSDPVKKLLDDIEVSEEKYKNIWKKVMKKFLSLNCRKAGRDKRSNNFDWKNKRALSMARLAPNYHKEQQEPQNINVYVDVSGSVNIELLEVIAKSLSIFCNQYEYSGINIIPWATTSNGSHYVESIKKSSPEKVAKEILGYISQGVDECGGGTELLSACLPEIVSISNDKKRHKKDDKHIIITDGQTYGEDRIESLISKECGEIVTKNCFWMIYDPTSHVKESWEKAITKGILLFINSGVVIGNN